MFDKDREISLLEAPLMFYRRRSDLEIMMEYVGAENNRNTVDAKAIPTQKAP